MQNNKDVKASNVTTSVALDQKLHIRREDLESIENATNTVVHWFVDCQYVRQTKEFNAQHIFVEPNKTHLIEALIEATFEPLKSIPTLKSKLISSWREQHKADLPFICNNQSNTVPDPNKVYGHFKTNVTVFGNEKPSEHFKFQFYRITIEFCSSFFSRFNFRLNSEWFVMD